MPRQSGNLSGRFPMEKIGPARGRVSVVPRHARRG
jgi:hypothetical protein